MKVLILALLSVSTVVGAVRAAGRPKPRVLETSFERLTIRHQPPPPPYTKEARVGLVQGVVRVRVTLDREGVPVRVRALEGPRELRPTAEWYARSFRFEPTRIDGVPVAVRFTLAVPFRL